MNLIIHTPDNRSGKHDGDEFRRQAKRIYREGDTLVNIRTNRYRLRPWKKWREIGQQLMEALDTDYRYDRVIFLCHGYPRKIQCGINLKNLPKMAAALSKVLVPGGDIILFCCSVSRNRWAPKRPTKKVRKDLWLYTQKSIAQALADEIECTVYGHYTAGHTTRNPWVVRHAPGEANWHVPTGRRIQDFYRRQIAHGNFSFWGIK